MGEEAALPYHFLEVTIAEGITEIPAYAEKDYFVLVMTSFEWMRFRNARLESALSGRANSVG
jgi:hypothetical protein